MKRLYSFMLAGLLIVALSACGKQMGTESSADKAAEQYGQTESVEIAEQPQIQEGNDTVTGDISFNNEKTMLSLYYKFNDK